MNDSSRSRATSPNGLIARLLVLTALASTACTGSEYGHSDNRVTPVDFLESLEGAEFPQPKSPWDFRFPADHASHDQYRTEWWNLTGVLTGGDSRVFGFELAFARVGIRAGLQDRASRWAASNVYVGLMSVSGTGIEGALTYERVTRASLGLAGARSDPLRLWVEDWKLEQATSALQAVNLQLRIDAEDLALDLELRTSRSPIDSNAVTAEQFQRAAPLVFYIQPRLNAKGMLRINDRTITVGGVVSMEHAWGELPFPGGPVARNRFTLFLEDGRDLFCIQSHRTDGSGSPTVSCLLTNRDGETLRLSGEQIALESLKYWKSERTGARYPVSWALHIPNRGIDLRLVPFSPDQEGIGWTPFWAGPVRIKAAGGQQAGYGLVLLNGYNDTS